MKVGRRVQGFHGRAQLDPRIKEVTWGEGTRTPGGDRKKDIVDRIKIPEFRE